MEQSLIVYSIVIPLFYFLAKGVVYECGIRGNNIHIHQRKKKFFTKCTILILVSFSFFCGIRYDVGKDYIGYLVCYMNFDQSGDILSNKFEFGFTQFVSLCNTIKLPPVLYFGLIALIQMSFFLLAFRRERYLWPLLLLFFFVNGGFMLWMNGIRQCMALCIWMSSLYYIEDKKPIPYFLLCLLATSFHTTAIFLFILYPILKKGKLYIGSISVQFIVIFIALVVRFTVIDFIFEIADIFLIITGGVYDHYLDKIQAGGSTYSNTNIVYWFRILIYFVIVLYSDHLVSFYKSKRFNIVYTLFFIGIVSMIVIPLDLGMLLRPFLYFTFFDSVMLAYLVFYLSKTQSRDNFTLMVFLILSFVAVFFANQIISKPNSSVWYQFIFDQPSTIFMNLVI